MYKDMCKHVHRAMDSNGACTCVCGCVCIPTHSYIYIYIYTYCTSAAEDNTKAATLAAEQKQSNDEKAPKDKASEEAEENN